MDIPNISSYNRDMFDELVKLESAIEDFERDADNDFVDPRRLSAAIDRLQGKLCRVVAAAKKRNQHLLTARALAHGWQGNATCPRPPRPIGCASAASSARCRSC